MTDTERQRGVERTTELQAMKGYRKWTPEERSEFQTLLQELMQDNRNRLYAEMDQRRIQTQKAKGVH